MRAWKAADLTADRSWIHVWSAEEIDAFVSFADAVGPHALEADPGLASELASQAPAVLQERADWLRNQLIDGHGLALLAGLQPSAMGYEALAAGFVLFGALVGSLRSQNASGDLLGHVADVGADAEDPTTRIYQTNRRQTFHTDSTDAVALLCIRTAQQGGASMVVNVEAVHDELKRRAPSLLARLFEPVATDRRGEQPEGELPWFEIPVFSGGDRITGIYQRQYIDSAARFENAPKPDAEFIAALDLLDEVMNDPSMHYQMEFSPGDVQFVHNHSLLHDRTGFIDADDPTERRHLLRLWMSLPGDRELPDVFAQRYGTTTVGDRGGIVVPGTTPQISLHPPQRQSS